MVEKIIQQAETALLAGDVVGAMVARKALAYTIMRGGYDKDHPVIDVHQGIYDGIGVLIKANLSTE